MSCGHRRGRGHGGPGRVTRGPARRVGQVGLGRRGCRIRCNGRCWRPGRRRPRPRSAPAAGARDCPAPPLATTGMLDRLGDRRGHLQVVAVLVPSASIRSGRSRRRPARSTSLRPGDRLQAGRHPAAVDVDLPDLAAVALDTRCGSMLTTVAQRPNLRGTCADQVGRLARRPS